MATSDLLIDFDSEDNTEEEDESSFLEIENYFKDKIAKFHDGIKDKISNVTTSEDNKSESGDGPSEITTDLLESQLDSFLNDFLLYKNKNTDENLIRLESSSSSEINSDEECSDSDTDDDDEEEEEDEDESTSHDDDDDDDEMEQEESDDEGSEEGELRGEEGGTCKDNMNIDKSKVAISFDSPVRKDHLKEYEQTRKTNLELEQTQKLLLDLDFSSLEEELKTHPTEDKTKTNVISTKPPDITILHEKKQTLKNKEINVLNQSKIFTKKSNETFECTLCFVVLRTTEEILAHSQNPFHQQALQSSLVDNSPHKETKTFDGKQRPKPPALTNKDQKPSTTTPNTQEKQPTKLARAMGMACIQPVSANQMKCTMCNSLIPVAADFSSLMKNISHHIQGNKHLKSLKNLEEKLVDIKLESIKKKTNILNTHILKDTKPKPRYVFKCLICNFDGHNFNFCKSHMQSDSHNFKLRIISNSLSGSSFIENKKCPSCYKALYGPLPYYDLHIQNCQTDNRSKKHNFETKRNLQVNKNQEVKEGKAVSKTSEKFKPSRKVTSSKMSKDGEYNATEIHRRSRNRPPLLNKSEIANKHNVHTTEPNLSGNFQTKKKKIRNDNLSQESQTRKSSDKARNLKLISTTNPDEGKIVVRGNESKKIQENKSNTTPKQEGKSIEITSTKKSELRGKKDPGGSEKACKSNVPLSSVTKQPRNNEPCKAEKTKKIKQNLTFIDTDTHTFPNVLQIKSDSTKNSNDSCTPEIMKPKKKKTKEVKDDSNSKPQDQKPTVLNKKQPKTVTVTAVQNIPEKEVCRSKMSKSKQVSANQASSSEKNRSEKSKQKSRNTKKKDLLDITKNQ